MKGTILGNASMTPKLPDDAEQLLFRLAEKQSRKYQDRIDIDQQFLKELGFDTKESLDRAVTSLNNHAHEHGCFWANEAPILYIEHNQLIPGPSIESAWSRYKAHQRM
jgi:hypothetical protein